MAEEISFYDVKAKKRTPLEPPETPPHYVFWLKNEKISHIFLILIVIYKLHKI